MKLPIWKNQTDQLSERGAMWDGQDVLMQYLTISSLFLLFANVKNAKKIVLSSIPQEDSAAIHDMLSSIGGNQVLSYVDDSVSVLIAGGSGRTIKVLKALSLGTHP